MASILIDNSSISYFCAPNSMECHTIRIMLFEKDVNVKVHQDLEEKKLPRQITDNNPYLSLPTLIDRELVLYFPEVIIDYLEERFPHPPVLPVTPSNRAQLRLYLQRLKNDWLNPAEELLNLNKRSEKKRKELTKQIRDSLVSSIDLFTREDFLLSSDFSLLDCYVLPFLWRLNWMGINIKNPKTKPMVKYMQRMFKRQSFLRSCTQFERSMVV